MVVSSLYLRGILPWNKASHFRYYVCNPPIPEGGYGWHGCNLPIPEGQQAPYTTPTIPSLGYRELTTIMLSIVPYPIVPWQLQHQLQYL